MPNKNALRIAHFPQVPCRPFTVNVKDVQEAIKVYDILCNYDLFQLQNRIKGDYANMCILEEFDQEEQEWLSWRDHETGMDFHEYLAERAAERR